MSTTSNIEYDSIDMLMKKAKETKFINITEQDIPTFYPTEHYKIITISLDSQMYEKQIPNIVDLITCQVKDETKSNQLFTALYEAILNAHQHGNKNNPNKKITIAYNINDQYAEVIVIDEGGLIDAKMIPFIKQHRLNKGHTQDFYQFTDRQKNGKNNGTGTSFMHLYTDKITYYKSEQGGLAVQLLKNLE